jgi:hypothetical protein
MYIDQKAYRAAKSRLTRAWNALRRAQQAEDRGAVMVAANRLQNVAVGQLREWERDGRVWPDDWSRWQRAADDAALAIRLGR